MKFIGIPSLDNLKDFIKKLEKKIEDDEPNEVRWYDLIFKTFPKSKTIFLYELDRPIKALVNHPCN